MTSDDHRGSLEEAELLGLSYRVRIEHSGIRAHASHIPDGAVAHLDEDGNLEWAQFDYLRVTGDSLEDALHKVDAHHQQRWGHLGGRFTVGLHGYNLDGVPIVRPLVLLSFEPYGDGWEWEIGDVAEDALPGHTTRYRTDSSGQGLWRWATGDRQWVQVLGHLQWHGLPTAEALMRRWGLADRREQGGAQRVDQDLITAVEVVELLHELGRPVGLATLRNYTARPPAGWPGPAKRVGRTPLWSREAIETYARGNRSPTEGPAVP